MSVKFYLKQSVVKFLKWLVVLIIGLLVLKPFEQAFQEKYPLKDFYKSLLTIKIEKVEVKSEDVGKDQAKLEPHSESYNISLGVIENKIRAEGLVRQLKAYGFNSWIEQDTKKHRIQVYVGSFVSKEEAKATADRIRVLIGKWTTIIYKPEEWCDQ